MQTLPGRSASRYTRSSRVLSWFLASLWLLGAMHRRKQLLLTGPAAQSNSPQRSGMGRLSLGAPITAQLTEMLVNKYFLRLREDVAECMGCKKKLKWASDDPSNLWSHFEKAHSSQLKSALRSFRAADGRQGQSVVREG